jgi:uncharacterized protein (TIGR03437 family)
MNPRIGCLLALLFGFAGSSSAQEYSNWVNGAPEQLFQATDAAGNLYLAYDGANKGVCGYIGRPVEDGGNGQSPIPCPAVVVKKMDATAVTTLYAVTFLTSLDDYVYNLAVDPAGNAYVTGLTGSKDFPVTAGAVSSQAAFRFFVMKLNPAGALIYSATFPADRSSPPSLAGFQVDSAGQAYLAGDTTVASFPIVNPVQQAATSGGFALKLDAAGTALVYSTFLGASGVAGLAVGGDGSAYLAGSSAPPQFATPGAFSSGRGGLFAARIRPQGLALEYAAVFGGSAQGDAAAGIAVDSQGRAVIAATAYSADLPVVNAFQEALPAGPCLSYSTIVPCRSGFVAMLNAAGAAFVYATYLGGSGRTAAQSILADADGTAYIVGNTESRDFPITDNAFQRCNASSSNFFVSSLTPQGQLAYGTYFGNYYPAGLNSITRYSGSSLLVSFVISFWGPPPDATYLGTNLYDYTYLAILDPSAPVPDQPDVQARCVVNAADRLMGGFPNWQADRWVAPGEMVSVLSPAIGPRQAVYATGAPLPSELAGVHLLFDGVPAPLLSVQFGRIDAVTPFGLAGKTSTKVQVVYAGKTSDTVVLDVQPNDPQIFALDGSGAGLAAALNQDGTVNTPENPAPKGSIVSLWATGGASQLSPPGIDGRIATAPLSTLLWPVGIYIGNIWSELLYIGEAPGMAEGIIQVNARIPANAPSGPYVPVALVVGAAKSNTSSGGQASVANVSVR